MPPRLASTSFCRASEILSSTCYMGSRKSNRVYGKSLLKRPRLPLSHPHPRSLPPLPFKFRLYHLMQQRLPSLRDSYNQMKLQIAMLMVTT